MGYLTVFLGAGLGGATRHAVGLASARAFNSAFPAGTLIVNVVGSVLMGGLAAYFSLRMDLNQSWRLFLVPGFLGGFTTFSAFSLETILLYERGRPGLALAYVLASVLLSLAGLIAGMAVVRSMETV